MKIRESVNNDKDIIRTVHQNAFGATEGITVSQLAIDLLEDITATPILSLVAECNGKVVGNIIFSSVMIEGKEGFAYILAPLAVLKDSQGKGIGTALINHGLKTLKVRRAKLVFVYGDPDFYKRTGFVISNNVKPPYNLEHPEAWMVQELTQGVLAKTHGMIKCANCLNSQEYW